MTSLYFKDGSSDKIYSANIVPNGDLYDVVFSYGRRGSTQTTGKKNIDPVSAVEASHIYNRLIREKQAKGYSEGEDGAAYVATDKEDRYTGVLPMLLNPIEESELDYYITNDEWCAEEKFDGRRMQIRREHGLFDAINRKGLIVGCPEAVLNEARMFGIRGNFVADGEIVGEKYHIFDVPNEKTHWDRVHDRYLLFQGMPREHIVEVETHYGIVNKTIFLYELRTRNAEGIVFKRSNSLYKPGRPNSGGDAVKFKFYATASVFVGATNKVRSVGMFVYDNGVLTQCGNVSIPPNVEVPAMGDIIEVRYLYAYKGSNALFQPVYLGVRDDLRTEDCKLSQFKFKAEEDEG